MNTSSASLASMRTIGFRLLDRRAQLIAFLIIIGTILSAIIPPFQSPDEFDHVKRAYLLSKGQFILVSPPNANSGGYIDNGLLSYMDAFTHLPHEGEHKVDREDIVKARQSTWTRTTNFSAAPGTGYYFPLVYLPQAVGLAVGEALDLTVDKSYRLARLLALTLSIALIFLASRIYPTNLLTLALLAMPMTIFQMVSASLDGTTTALAILCISLFMRAMDRDLATARWMAWLLPVSLLLLVTSRTHLLPLVGIPLVLFIARRKTMDLVLFAVLTILSLAWLYIAMRYTIDLRVTRTHTTGYMIGYYLARPGAFFKLIWASLMDTELRLYYQETFVGVLGWLDLKFQSWFYQLSILFCVLMGALSVHWKTIRRDWQVRGWLLGFAALSSLLVFFLLLVTWTPHPATVVLGVQGRYFLIPFILVAYALKGQDDAVSPRRKLLALPVFYLYLLLLSVVMPQELIYRYFAH